MYPFLKSVAQGYAERYGTLSEFCFVFPSKRAGTFFLKYLRQEAGDAMLSPEVMTVSDFVSEVADRVVSGRVDQLFRLYNVYRVMWQGEETPVDFDSFRGWGETVLADFNEIDMYGVSADEIFKNVKDYREIASNFLTDEQRRVMEEYFGRPVGGGGEAVRFWRDFGSEDELSPVKKRFLYLWKVMAPLYHGLAESLDKNGYATSGGVFRIALERLSQMPPSHPGVRHRKVVFVGFNALSRTESEILSTLAGFDPYPGPEGDEPYADFWWDTTGPVLRSGENSASRFVASNRRRFPEPAWSAPYLQLSEATGLPPVMRVVAAPSGSVQVKLIADELKRIKAGGEKADARLRDARVAVVLPDESLLLPLLYSLPDDIGAVNLTMGYPLRLTSAISFVGLLRRLQLRRRSVAGHPGYYHEELRLLLSHPYSHALLGTDAVQRVKARLDTYRLSALSVDELETLAPGAGALMSPIPKDATPMQVIEYIDSVMESVDRALGRADGKMVKSRLDRTHIAAYRDALRRLADSVAEHGVAMQFNTVFSLADRLLAGEQVSFEGEPLEGLQVMGMLETRAIDFDRIIIPSLNERILPMKARSRTFIPDTLRVAYGMPPANFRESLFAYYFYRMISRADEVVMLYDARAGGGMRSGDVSRYLLQLRHLYAPDTLQWEERRFTIGKPGGVPQPVEKDKLSLRLLEEFSDSGKSKRYLSASALSKYMSCPVRFYYEHVVGLRADNPPARYIDAISHGNIVHDVMMRIYLPAGMEKKFLNPGREIKRADILALLKDTTRVDTLLVQAINREHFHRDDDALDTPLEGETLMVAQRIREQILQILRHDLSLAPFTLYGTEVPGEERVNSGGVTVNMKFSIDRVDSVGGMRIVDYKTGSVHLDAEDMDCVFNGELQARNIFQLMLYANLLNRKLERGDQPVRMEIYDVSNILSGELCVPKISKQEVLAHIQTDDVAQALARQEREGEENEAGDSAEESVAPVTFNSQFMERTHELIKDIFNTEKAFTPTRDERVCRLCNLASLCRR